MTETFSGLIEFAEQLAEEWRLELEADALPTYDQLVLKTKPELRNLATSSVSVQQFGNLGGKRSYYLENMSRLTKQQIVTGIINVWPDIVQDRQDNRRHARQLEYKRHQYDSQRIG